jgi:hypothetical protein
LRRLRSAAYDFATLCGTRNGRSKPLQRGAPTLPAGSRRRKELAARLPAFRRHEAWPWKKPKSTQAPSNTPSGRFRPPATASPRRTTDSAIAVSTPAISQPNTLRRSRQRSSLQGKSPEPTRWPVRSLVPPKSRRRTSRGDDRCHCLSGSTMGIPGDLQRWSRSPRHSAQKLSGFGAEAAELFIGFGIRIRPFDGLVGGPQLGVQASKLAHAIETVSAEEVSAAPFFDTGSTASGRAIFSLSTTRRVAGNRLWVHFSLVEILMKIVALVRRKCQEFA